MWGPWGWVKHTGVEMAKRKRKASKKMKASDIGGLVVIGGVIWLLVSLFTSPPTTEDRIKALTEKEASHRQSAAEYRAKANAEIARYSPEVAEANEKLAREENRHYGHKKHEGNARYADQIADETRREIERLKAGRSQ
jgi:hypothetical protein